MKRNFFLMTIICLIIITNFLCADEFYISFDGPYLKSFPAKVPAQFITSAGIRNIYCSFTADWTTGKIGTKGFCFEFSGNTSSNWYWSNAWVNVPNDAVINIGTSDFGISFWIKTSSTRYNNTVCDKRVNQHHGDGYVVTIYGGKPLLQMSSDINGWANYWANTATAIVNDGKWHNVSIFVTRNSTTGGKIYVDGKCVLTFNPTKFQNDYISNNENLYIGRHIASPGSNFTGFLDDFHIWKN